MIVMRTEWLQIADVLRRMTDGASSQFSLATDMAGPALCIRWPPVVERMGPHQIRLLREAAAAVTQDRIQIGEPGEGAVGQRLIGERPEAFGGLELGGGGRLFGRGYTMRVAGIRPRAHRPRRRATGSGPEVQPAGNARPLAPGTPGLR